MAKRGRPRKNEAEKIVKVRQSTHGDFTDGARFTQGVMKLAMVAPSWSSMTDVQKEGFHHIVQKLQRAVCGDPNHADHWNDVAGYALIVSKRIGQ